MKATHGTQSNSGVLMHKNILLINFAIIANKELQVMTL
jgi:hypothetical protein